MKTEFTAKYLQHLAKKNKDGGFTLIELLVVIIIVGVLAAIALPSFLNQIGKARGSEARSNLGTINRAQQAYRLENNEMADALTRLDARISGKFYSYSIVNKTDDTATAFADNQTNDDLRNYIAGVNQVPGTDTVEEFFGSIICESVDNDETVDATVAGTITLPVEATPDGACPTDFDLVD